MIQYFEGPSKPGGCCRQLLLTLAEWLCEHHNTDARAARIIQGMHLFLVPTVNPDGFASKARGNRCTKNLPRTDLTCSTFWTSAFVNPFTSGLVGIGLYGGGI